MLKKLSNAIKRRVILGHLAALKFSKKNGKDYVDYTNRGNGYVKVLYKHSYFENGGYRVVIHCSRCDTVTTLPTTSLSQKSCGCMGRGRPKRHAAA